MNVFSFVAGNGYGWLLAVVSAPLWGYAGLYLLFRCWGKLRVNADGWHAAGIFAGTRVLLSALRVFGFFQPLLRLESALARKAAGLLRSRSGEQPVSEVVVELIPFT